MQVHGIFNMIEFLALYNRLSAFIESLALSSTRGVDVFHLLSREVVQLTGLDQNPSMNTVAKCFGTIAPSLGGSRSRSFLLNVALLECTFDARAEFSKAYSRIPGFGWPLVLMKMWPKLQSKVKNPKAEEERYKAIEQLGQLRDLTSRYLLVAPLHERCVVAALAGGLDCTGGDIWVEDPFMDPKDFRDLEGVASSLFRQLSTRPAENTVAGLRHLDIMSEYTFQLARLVERYQVYPRLLTAAYNRLWIEITCNPSDRYPAKDVAYYGLSCLRYARCAYRLLSEPNAYLMVWFSEGCSMSGMTFGSGDSSLLSVASSLSEADFFNLIGRLFLSYVANGGESGSASGKSFSPCLCFCLNYIVIAADEFISEVRSHLTVLSCSIAKHAESLRTTFRPYYFDWLNVLRYISQIPSMSLPSTQLLLPHLEQLIFAWVHMGKAVGYSEDYVAPPCFYARCPGFEVVDYQSVAWGGCLHTAYCTPKCQQA